MTGKELLGEWGIRRCGIQMITTAIQVVPRGDSIAHHCIVAFGLLKKAHGWCCSMLYLALQHQGSKWRFFAPKLLHSQTSSMIFRPFRPHYVLQNVDCGIHLWSSEGLLPSLHSSVLRAFHLFVRVCPGLILEVSSPSEGRSRPSWV